MKNKARLTYITTDDHLNKFLNSSITFHIAGKGGGIIEVTFNDLISLGAYQLIEEMKK